MAAGSSKLPEFSCQDAQHCIPIPKKIQARGAGIAELEVWILLSCPAEPHTCCEDLPGSYLVNWEVRDVGCWIWGPRGFGNFHTACQGLPGLISVHPPLPALGMRKHRLVGAGSAPVPLKSQAGAPEHLGMCCVQHILPPCLHFPSFSDRNRLFSNLCIAFSLFISQKRIFQNAFVSKSILISIYFTSQKLPLTVSGWSAESRMSSMISLAYSSRSCKAFFFFSPVRLMR